MRKIFLPVAVLLCLLSIRDRPAHAQAAPPDASAQIDAPTSVGSGSAVTTVTTGTTVTATGSDAPTTTSTTTTQTTISVPPNPISDPLGFLASLKTLWSISWGLAVGAAALGLAELASWIGKEDPNGKLAFLGQGRVSIVIGGVIATLTTAIASMTGSSGFGWLPFLISIGGSILAYWHQAATPEAIALTDKAKAAGLPIATAVKIGKIAS